MLRIKNPGNTLSEYGILFALVTVAAAGSIVMFGGSTSQLLGGPGTNMSFATTNILAGATGAQTINSPSGAGGNGSTSGQGASWTDQFLSMIGGQNPPQSAGTQPGASMTPGYADLNSTSAVSGVPLSGGGSGGTNVTSIEGKIQKVNTDTQIDAVQQTLKLAEEMQRTADKLDDGPLKAWYQEAARYTLLLAGSEATFSYKADGITQLQVLADTSLASQDALWSMQQNRLLLGNKLYDFPSNLYPGQEAQALSMVNSVLDTMWSQYDATLNKYTVGQSTMKGREKEQINFVQVFLDMGIITKEYSKSPEEVLALSKTAMANGELDTNSPAVYSGAVNGAVLDQRAH